MKVKSKALEINLAGYHVDVAIDEKYATLQEVMSKYYGLKEGLNTFLKELSHPYKNWRFIVTETRKYGLEYFHLIKSHPKGPAAANLLADIFFEAIAADIQLEVKADAVDNLILFLQKTVKESDTCLEGFLPFINGCFLRMEGLSDDLFELIVRSYYQINRLAETFLGRLAESDAVFDAVNRLLIKFFNFTYRYWLSERDPHPWLQEEVYEFRPKNDYGEYFKNISHSQLQNWKRQLDRIADSRNQKSDQTLASLLNLPGFNQIVEKYRRIPAALLKKGGENGHGMHVKLIFLFHVMNTGGLALIHEDTLRDINLTLGWIIENENYRHIEKLIRKTFSILKERSGEYPATALNCVLNMGKGVYKTDNIDLINFFIDSVIDLGFATPNIQGVDNNWQTRVNKSHILNIRTWLELIELNPKRSIRLLSALIVYLSLYGVFIKDIDLFPRNITQFLNSGIGPVFNLCKQLARIFPVYFNDIGAEGRLRDISTRIDEVTQRRDSLIHFLRKQSHVESSNRIIDLVEGVFHFWQTRDKTALAPHIPPAIYDQVATQGPYIDGVFQMMKELGEKGIRIPDDLLAVGEETIRGWLREVNGVSGVDRERVELAAAFYKLLNQKYHFNLTEMDAYLAPLRAEALPGLNRLEKALTETDMHKRLFLLLEYMEKLKAVILSDKTYEIRQDIYKKRHITIDIPSMYGSYHEMKFDCLGLSFRIESLMNVLFEELVEKIDLSLITKATFHQIYGLLRLFDRALKLDGISSEEYERQLEFLAHSLEVKGFTLTQYLDIFKGFTQAVKNIVNDYFNNIHGQNITRILLQIPTDALLPKFLPQQETVDSEKMQHRVSEIFFRDRIAQSLGLQQLDLFLSRILSTLFQQSYKLPKDKLQRLLLYDPQNAVTPIDSTLSRLTGIIYLGNKGLNMVRLKSFGYPVPPGFIITTEVFRCREIIESYPPAEQNFKENIIQNIAALEKATGKIFGDPQNPLLLSVRSGSAISQPGMMLTLLDVGNNEEITQGISRKTGNAWFAWDNYRRFLQCYGMSFGMKRDDFDAVISSSKRRLGVPLKKEFTGDQMREVALAYKNLIRDAGIELVETPYEQLHLAIKRVLASWESNKAMAYRRIIGISEDWGTAVTVQAMVYGNLSQSSGTGVVFTHNPRWSGDTLKLWGDFTVGNQGEDVVAGLVKTMPISLFQQEIEMRDTDVTMETHFPEIYRALDNWAHDLIDGKGWSPQEIEFTFEGPSKDDLYLLQTRDMAIRERKKVLTFDFEENSQAVYLGHGVGVSGGALSGRLVFTLEEIEEWRDMDPGANLILARNDTVPDDIQEIHAADGLLTARGGQTSHAAVIAHRLGKTCVVNCTNLNCNEREKYCEFNQVRIKFGEHISIDGQEGSVYQGLIRVKEA